MFKDSLLEGSILQNEAGQTDIFIFYKGEEFPCMKDFGDKYPLTPEEDKELIDTINKLIK
jgi:hypothetical protein